MSERFMVDNCGTLIDKTTRNTYDYVSEVCPVLNMKEEEIQELKARNKRQYKLLKKITSLMYERNWKRLETMVNDWEQWEKQLEEW